MTEAELTEKAQEWVDTLQLRLGLKNWAITARVAEVPHGQAWAYGTNAMVRHEYIAEVHVARNLAPEMLPHTVAHEMAHLLLDPVQVLWESLGDAVPEAVAELMKTETERLCNRIAFAVVGS